MTSSPAHAPPHPHAREPRITPGLVLSGVVGLALVAIASRGRIRGRYWTWRTQTAFGPGASQRRFPHALAFGDWARRMRRFAR